MISVPLVSYVLRAALRDRVVLSAIVLSIVMVSLSLFVGDAAIVEKVQFVMVYASGGLRLLAVAAAVLFTAFYIQRSFAQRDIEYLLSRPLSRETFILSHVVALFVLTAVLAVICGLSLLVLSGGQSAAFVGIWTLSLFFEVFLTSLVAFFFGMVLESATVSTLMTLAFYVLARMVGQLLGIMQENVPTWGRAILEPVMKMISMLMPRFDLMTQSSWLVYGPQGAEGVLFLLSQSLAFGFLVIIAAVIDLKRRQF